MKSSRSKPSSQALVSTALVLAVAISFDSVGFAGLGIMVTLSTSSSVNEAARLLFSSAARYEAVSINILAFSSSLFFSSSAFRTNFGLVALLDRLLLRLRDRGLELELLLEFVMTTSLNVTALASVISSSSFFFRLFSPFPSLSISSSFGTSETSES